MRTSEGEREEVITEQAEKATTADAEGSELWAPVVWPETETPAPYRDCNRCELSKQRTRVVWGEGNEHSPLLAVLDNPGAREDREGSPFVCATRAALQRTASDVGLAADDVYVTYLLKCRPIRKYDKETARAACLPFLREQLGKERRAVLLLGLVAAQTVLDAPDAEMAELRNRWHEVEGLPPMRVTYHPLAVHRRPNLRKSFLEDWRAVADRLATLSSLEKPEAPESDDAPAPAPATVLVPQRS
ncbi:uracil-DNA glycosylase [Paenibacillus sp. TRM 82003]|nr:uracil-DNA glycosylase [Paenibacillus sp. TRM 82003]